MTEGIRFDPAQIRELARILRDTDLSEIELVEKDSRIRVVRQVTVMAGPATASVVATVPAAAAAPAGAGAPAAVAAVEAEPPHPGAVTSPMVGVVYLSPEPGSEPFVQLGARVTQGQTVLLIEAMKTFNQIKAPKAGTVTRILIENGAPVEYGEPLLVIE